MPDSLEVALRRKGRLWLAYDVAWTVLATVVYGVSLLPMWAWLQGCYGLGGWPAVVFGALPGYLLFVATLVAVLSLLGRLCPPVQPGIYDKFSKGSYTALILRAGVTSLMQNTPFIRTVNFLAVLRYAYYRGQGMRTHFSNWLGADAIIADPALVTLGRGVSLGDLTAISAHLALPDRMVIQPVTIGEGTLVGAAAKIGPGAEIGPHVLIGADAALGVGVRIGEGAYVEPFSRVASHTVIGPYERWGGNPAVKVGDRSPSVQEASA